MTLWNKMDRNTLVAFLLISVVLIFTPKYMDFVSPPPNIEEIEVFGESNEKPMGVSSILKPDSLLYTEKQKRTEKNNSEAHNETITTIENNLYRATVSSINGGSFTSFVIKNYYKPDSIQVDLLSGLKNDNLLFFIEDLDGKPINVKRSWKLETEYIPKFLNDEHTLVYSLVVMGEKITKKLTFSPDTYALQIEIDCSKIRNTIFRDLEVGWFGGLTPTEEDVVGDQAYFKSYVFQGGELESQKVKLGESEEQSFNGPANWVAVRTKYFVSAFIPENPSSVEKTILTSDFQKNERYNVSFVVESGRKSVFTLYLGPLEYDQIKALSVDLDMVMDFGWSFIRPISKGVLYSLKEIHKFVPNYGFVLIIFSFLVKLIVYPLTKKSYQSTAAMQTIQPEISALRDKYKSNPQKLNQATMQLYKEKGVNPLGGCLPMLLQMPLLFALFQVFRTTIELRAEPFVWWIKDLSAPDTIIHLPFTVPIYGNQISVLPILMVVSMFIQQRMMSPGAQQPQQKTMQYFMTGFFFLMFNSFPSGLNLYYTLFNVLTILQQKLVPNTPAPPTKTKK
jgi:YidC/Oxa1 family membrane protein insertase